MSSSAFTPTQIEVTNEVPVNVPVVTRDTFFVPSIGISGTFASQKGEYQRSGNRMNARVQLTFATVSAINSPYTLTIPDSLNYDGSNIPVSDEPIVGTFSLWDASASYIEYIGTVHVNSATTLKFKAHGQTAFNNSSIPVTIAANDILEIQFSLPIAEWAGSGTTTLATRAVEEYAFNTSTSTTTGDTTSFGYGPNGAVIQNITANLARRVQFQSNILSTDKIVVEVSADRVTWIPVGGLLNGQVVDSFRFDGTNLCGIGINATPGFLNQVDVQFGIKRSTNADWSGVISGYYWRVRKVSSGAQVGYPVSARNIVGDTSGSVVPTGMLGQYLSENTTANGGTNTVPNVTNTNVRVLTLPAGTWDVVGYCSINNFPTTPVRQILSLVQTSATNGTQAIDRLDYMYPSSLTGSFGTSTPQVRLNLSAPTTLYLVMYSQGASGSVTVDGASIRATRIA